MWEAEIPKSGKVKILLQTDGEGYHLDGQEYELRQGKITIELPPTSGTILKYVGTVM